MEEIRKWLLNDIQDIIKDDLQNIDAYLKRVVGKTGFLYDGIPLGNKDCRHFREETSYGCDFRTICKPALVPVEVFSYDA